MKTSYVVILAKLPGRRPRAGCQAPRLVRGLGLGLDSPATMGDPAGASQAAAQRAGAREQDQARPPGGHPSGPQARKGAGPEPPGSEARRGASGPPARPRAAQGPSPSAARATNREPAAQRGRARRQTGPASARGAAKRRTSSRAGERGESAATPGGGRGAPERASAAKRRGSTRRAQKALATAKPTRRDEREPGQPRKTAAGLGAT